MPECQWINWNVNSNTKLCKAERFSDSNVYTHTKSCAYTRMHLHTTDMHDIVRVYTWHAWVLHGPPDPNAGEGDPLDRYETAQAMNKPGHIQANSKP